MSAEQPALTVAMIKNAINAAKLAREQSRKRWCSPDTVYHRGERCYILRPLRKLP